MTGRPSRRWVFGGIGAGAAYIFFRLHRLWTPLHHRAGCKNPQRDCHRHYGLAVDLHGFVHSRAGVLTGMVRWQDVNIEAPIAVAFLDRGLYTASHIITNRGSCGPHERHVVMLLGQTPFCTLMANDGLLPKKFFAAVHKKYRTPTKTRSCRVVAAIVRQHHPDRRHRKNGQYRHIARFRHGVYAVMILRRTNPQQPRPSAPRGVPVVPILGILFNGYMITTRLGQLARLIIWLVIGLVIFIYVRRYHSRVRGAAVK